MSAPTTSAPASPSTGAVIDPINPWVVTLTTDTGQIAQLHFPTRATALARFRDTHPNRDRATLSRGYTPRNPFGSLARVLHYSNGTTLGWCRVVRAGRHNDGWRIEFATNNPVDPVFDLTIDDNGWDAHGYIDAWTTDSPAELRNA
jgi:hypothetical protein